MYKDIQKDVFVDKYKKPNEIKNNTNLLKIMEELKSFLMELNENDIMQSKIYLSSYIVEGEDFQLIIIMTYANKYTFLRNNRI